MGTQGLYLLLFLCRYMDVFWSFGSMYNWCMKILFISTTALICWMMKFQKPYCKYYDPELDSFNVLYLIIPCFLLALVWNEEMTPFEISWAFSIYLEAVAALPQLHMLQRIAGNTAEGGSVENLTAHYIFA